MQAIVYLIDMDKGWLQLSTRMLEARPGDMLRDAQAVYDDAEAQAQVVQGKQERARRKLVSTRVQGLGKGGFDPLHELCCCVR